MQLERLSQIMAHRGMCSRREADRYIERGLVFVDGERISELGTKISPDAQIELSEEGKKRQQTQDGRIAKKIIGETSDVPKEYLVRVTGT